MKYILSILIILSSLSAIGQGTPTYQGNTTSISYNRGTVGALRMQLLPRGFYPFPTFDTLGTIWVDSANTRGLYYHNGTSRIRMASIPYVDSVALSIEAGSVDSSIYTTVTRLADSLHGLRDYVDSNNTIIYSNIATLQSDVVVLDSALGVAFGAISELYDTLPNYVPYTGATTDVNIGTHNILPNSVRLSTSPTGTLTNVGQLYFDATNLTPAIPLNANVTLQIGQEEHIRARNNTGVQINDGQVVYINDAQGNNPTIALANSDSVNTSEVIGVATENIADNGTGFVTTFGVVNGFNTSSFASGDVLYLNTVSGQLSNTIPTPPHNVVKVGIALNNTNNGKIFVQPSAPLGQDTTFAAPYNSDKVAPTQRSIGTYTRKIVQDTASALRIAINAKYGTSDTGRAATNIVTGGGLNKVADSLNTLIAAKGSGSVTSIQLVGGTNVTITPTTAITTSGVYTISATGGGSSTPTTTVNYKVLYKSGDSIKAASKVNIDTTDGRMVLDQNTDTSSVSAFYGGGTKIVGRNRMGMSSLVLVDTVAIPAALQRALNAQITSTLMPNTTILTGAGATGNYSIDAPVSIMAGASTINVVGAYNSTIQHFNYTKIVITTSTSANQTVGIRTNSTIKPLGIICGNTKFSSGGGRGTFTFALPTYNAGQRIFVGYNTVVGTPLTDPTTFLGAGNALGVGKDATDTELQFFYGNNVTTPTKVSTGITPNAEDVYRVTVYVAPNSRYYIQLEVLNKNRITVRTFNPTANVPPVSTKLFPMQYINNATTSAAIQYGFIYATEEIY